VRIGNRLSVSYPSNTGASRIERSNWSGSRGSPSRISRPRWSLQPDTRVEVPRPADLNHVELAGQCTWKRRVGPLALHNAPDRFVDFSDATGNNDPGLRATIHFERSRTCRLGAVDVCLRCKRVPPYGAAGCRGPNAVGDVGTVSPNSSFPSGTISPHDARRDRGSYSGARASRYIAHDRSREWRVDELILSRLETEWLVAWFYDRSRQMPPQVQELLKSIGFIDGDNLTDAGRRWLQRADRTPSRRVAVGRPRGSGGGRPAFVEFETHSA